MRGSSGTRGIIHGLAGGRRRRLILLGGLALGAAGLWWRGHGAAAATAPRPQLFSPPSLRAYADGHARPRALAVDAGGDRLYVAGSTVDCLFVVDLAGAHPRIEATLRICAFPDALAPLPTGGVVVSCRFDPALRLVLSPGKGSGPAGGKAPGSSRFEVRAVPAGTEHGHRGLALDPSGRFAYVGSPARGGIQIVDLSAPPGTASAEAVRFVATGVSPQAVRFVPAEAPLRGAPLLLVANFIGHTVGVYPVRPDGGLDPVLQTIETAAPVLDLAVVPAAGEARWRGALVLATHEDRALSREHLAVEGLDSVLLVFPAAAPGGGKPFADPGAGRRWSVNLSERPRDPVVGLDALAVEAGTGRLAVVGAGSDNVVSTLPTGLADAGAVTVGGNPSAVAFLPSGGVVTADRLGDTLSFVDRAMAAVETLPVGRPERPTPAERGEVMFYSRALVPHNVATGPLSLYTCAGCHPDGHVDGRRHPSKRNRFYSMTKTCRGLLGTEPFLSIGDPDTFAGFADNILATHAQGALDAPQSYDQYPVSLRLRQHSRYLTVTLSPEQTRAALAAYLPHIPVEPSPFAPLESRTLAPAERRGLAVFRGHCSGCHQLLPATGASKAPRASAVEPMLRDARLVLTSALRYDVGTPVLGQGGNCPPSLRGVWAAAPYFSDGSAATLEDVLRRTDPQARAVHSPENTQHPPAFTAPEQSDLLSFLRTL